MRLADRVVLVTGGGRAVGKAISLRLAQEGADVILASPDFEELEETAGKIRELGRQSLVVVADVSQEDQVAELFRKAREELGRVDILINNAGIIGPTARIHEVSLDDWNRSLAVNLTGMFLCTREVMPEMMRRRSGKIINISSIAGRMAYALRSPYCSSKWGVVGLGLTAAKELGEYDCQVNVICPGPVDGERMRTLIKSRATELGKTVEEVTREYEGTSLLNRMVQAEDVAAMVAFLCSEDAKNITGEVIDVSGGYGV